MADRHDRPGRGDPKLTSGGIFDAAHHRLGMIMTACTAEGAKSSLFKVSLLCTVTYDTAHGQIIAVGMYKLDGSATMAHRRR